MYFKSQFQTTFERVVDSQRESQARNYVSSIHFLVFFIHSMAVASYTNLLQELLLCLAGFSGDVFVVVEDDVEEPG